MCLVRIDSTRVRDIIVFYRNKGYIGFGEDVVLKHDVFMHN